MRDGRLPAQCRAAFRPRVPTGIAIRATTSRPCCSTTTASPRVLARQDDYWSGQDEQSEFVILIGSPNNDCPLPNIQMIIFENNYGNNHSNVNKRFAGMAYTEFNWGFQWHLNQPTAELCDIILPAPIWQFEGMDEYMYGHQRFVSGLNGMRNYFTFCARGLDFPGEVRSKEWVWTEIAKRLGDEAVEGYNPA